MKAMDDEWNKLSKQIVWDLTTVRDKMRWPRRREITTSKCISEMFLALAVSKEIKEGDPAKKRKGRFVFRGSDVKDEYNDIAIF